MSHYSYDDCRYAECFGTLSSADAIFKYEISLSVSVYSVKLVAQFPVKMLALVIDVAYFPTVIYVLYNT